MTTLLQALAIGVLTGGLLLSNPTSAQLTPSAKKAARVRITQGPEIELAKDRLTIIRWTTNNPGGSPEHYGVVHYGEDPKNLTQMVKSHIRLNQGHRYTIFRVRLDDLKPRTTYYYSVDSMDARGTTDGVSSPVKTFRTQ
ncbi:MAG: hypothetical protein DMG34_19105 [Acidobacteria bacterium]|nr:MAG: hypothetical protein DMG34_19105 [Acidobacteriota bacterium]